MKDLGSGTIYTETVVYSPPEAYVNDVPYQLAIVELAGGRRVTGRVAGERAHIGDRVEFAEFRNNVPFFRKTIMKLAERMNRIGVETAFEVLVRARALEAQGRDIIHLEIGEPDFDTPRHIVEAGKQALDQGWTHYGPTQGCRSCARRSHRTFAARAEFAWAPSMCAWCRAASRSSFSH